MEYVATNNAPGAIGPYSQAVKANGFLFTSGQIAINPATNTVRSTQLRQKQSRSKQLRFAKISRQLSRQQALLWTRL